MIQRWLGAHCGASWRLALGTQAEHVMRGPTGAADDSEVWLVLEGSLRVVAHTHAGAHDDRSRSSSADKDDRPKARRPPLPHLPDAWAHWAHPCHICAGTGLIPATSAPGLGSPLPHLHRDCWDGTCCRRTIPP